MKIINKGQLRQYMLKRIGLYADLLSWNDATENGPFEEPANDVLIAFNKTEVSQITDNEALRAVAEFQAWKAVTENIGVYYDFGADGANYKRQQAVENARKNLDNARTRMQQLGIDTATIIIYDLPADSLF